jgi:malate dehydrogenase (oxaloacetate-decarboxylating)(NADP+)
MNRNPPSPVDLTEAALHYDRQPTPGKISVVPTKGLTNQRDLALAYSPGVAAACHAIVADGTQARELTSRSNLVGVVTNGTAVLGLGNIGPLAAKPVMEGKGVLFKKCAGIDVFDNELAESDPNKLIDMIAALEPTLGGVHLKDIKAPESFYIERKLREGSRFQCSMTKSCAAYSPRFGAARRLRMNRQRLTAARSGKRPGALLARTPFHE